MRSIKARVGVALAAGALALGLATPAQAQQEGLVNVDVDVTNNVVIVQVPIGVAANVCGVNAAVLATGAQSTDPVCEADVSQLPRAFAEQPGNGNGPPA
jgi:hypothetical protein